MAGWGSSSGIKGRFENPRPRHGDPAGRRPGALDLPCPPRSVSWPTTPTPSSSAAATAAGSRFPARREAFDLVDGRDPRAALRRHGRQHPGQPADLRARVRAWTRTCAASTGGAWRPAPRARGATSSTRRSSRASTRASLSSSASPRAAPGSTGSWWTTAPTSRTSRRSARAITRRVAERARARKRGARDRDRQGARRWRSSRSARAGRAALPLQHARERAGPHAQRPGEGRQHARQPHHLPAHLAAAHRGSLSTLGEELERATAYLEILRIRMGERLASQIQVPERSSHGRCRR
jgi:hypothetical protein